ncbi:MAG TPA: hypothetical protein VEA44_14725 [Caulobacter sp.]|nr:hypothetical protein [Caulobacter sp.]
MSETFERIVDSAAARLISRAAMALLALLLPFAWNSIVGKIDDVGADVAAIQATLTQVVTRQAVVDATMAQMSREMDGKASQERVDALEDSVRFLMSREQPGGPR